MTHCQIFYPFDNEDGFISVVCHRERFLDVLLRLGWYKTQEEAIEMRDALVKKDPGFCMGENCTASKSNNYDHSAECIAEYERTIGVKEPEHYAHKFDGEHSNTQKEVPMSIAGLSNKQRKKLSIKK